MECNQKPCGITSCTHNNDVGIICERKLYKYAITNFKSCTLIARCTDGDIRLGDGAVLQGRVEVCINDTWGTICDHHWTKQEASVVCSQLGYSPYGMHYTENKIMRVGIYT